TGKVGVVVVHTTLTEALVDEGILREITSRIQQLRKDQQLEFVDRIRVELAGSERVERVAREGAEHIRRECLALDVVVGAAADGAKEQAIGSESLKLEVSKA